MTEPTSRLQALQQRLAEQELDALVVHQAENRRYLTGFTGTAGWPIVTRSSAWLLVDGRYDERARREATGVTVVRLTGLQYEAIRECLVEARAERVGFEAETVSVAELERLRQAVPTVTWVPTSGLVEELRAVKSEAEIQRIRRAAALTDEAFAYACQHARPGMSEKELAWATEVFMREHGADGLAFDIIVASGPNGALPHHQSSDRPLARGEPIVIDLGARLEGYCADLTRTFSLGEATDLLYREVYEIVERANRTATARLRSGLTTTEADAAARQVIAGAGYGEQFVHGLGHGVGLNVHELPRLGPLAQAKELVAGMVVTIEPGIYLPGRFGVRIEDLVVVRQDGAEVLSQAPKQPVV